MNHQELRQGGGGGGGGGGGAGRSNVLDMIHQSARRGTLLASCEPEVKELMHQLDVMLSTRQREEEARLQGIRGQLQARERELSTLRVALQERTQKSESLKEELSKAEHQLRIRTSDHETQLLRLRTELNRLSKSYEKLKLRKNPHHQGRESELKDLREDLSICRSESAILRDKNSALEQQLLLYQASLKEKENSAAGSSSRVEQLQSQLKQAEHQLSSQEKKIRNMKAEMEERRSHAQASLAECQSLHEQLKVSQQSIKELQNKISQQDAQLKEKDKHLQLVKSDKAALSQRLEDFQKKLSHQERLIRTLEQQNGVRVEGEVASLRHQLRQLQEKLQQQLGHEKSLRDENDHLRKRNESLKESMQNRTSVLSHQEIHSRLEMKETELQRVESKLFAKERLVQELKERVDHLEKQLREVTLQLDSSETKLEEASQHISNLSAENTSLKDHTFSLVSRQSLPPATVHGDSNTTSSSSSPASSSVVPTHESTPTHRKAERNKGAEGKREHDYSDQRQVDHMVELFRKTLDSVMEEHFSKMDQSLQLLLQPVPAGIR